MSELTYTLIADGSSDRALMPVIEWLLKERLTNIVISASWADFRFLKERPEGLSGQLKAAHDLYPSKFIFIHRDCENESVGKRRQEIEQAVVEAFGKNPEHIIVCIIPRRMTEAWLLISESAIRTAAGNPHGNTSLVLPRTRDLESLTNPKEKLFELIRNASELSNRRLANLNVNALVHRVAELIDDYSTLNAVPAFVEFGREVDAALIASGFMTVAK